MNVHFKSERLDGVTPQAFFDELNKEFDFTLDPCATDESAKCDRYYTIDDNGLDKSWANERVFMNPPYGREIKKWMEKAYLESKMALIVCLIPSRTDTKWWHDYVMKANEIRFIKGRLKFENYKANAPFPSAIVIFTRKIKEERQ